MERSVGEKARQHDIKAWAFYIIGLPFWLVILSQKNDWMVTFAEAGGGPSMFLGLIIALRKIGEEPSKKNKKLANFFDMFGRVAAVFGIAFSFYHVGMMTKTDQWLELGVIIGFLIGTYRLANKHLDGYLWFLLMNVSCCVLMYHQDKRWLAIQQALSLVFVLDAYFVKKRKEAFWQVY